MNGIDRPALEATPEAPGNLANTCYVLEAGYSGDFLDLRAALAPCVLRCGDIGRRLEIGFWDMASGPAPR